MSGTREFELLVIGELNPDAIILDETVEPRYGQVEQLVEGGVLTIGSSGAIAACGAARLGMRTAYVGVAGDDLSGRFLLAELKRRGIGVESCRVEPGSATGLSVVLSRGSDRAILTFTGAMSSLTPADVDDDTLAAADHLHLSSPHLQSGIRDGLAGLFGRAHAAGTRTSLDPGWDPAGEWGAGLDEVLDLTDVFIPNAAEACRFTGTDDPEAALDRLAGRCETVAVKLGADGAVARRGGETVRAGALEVEPVDATGAGDSFAAGLLSAFSRGEGLEQALRLAVACGSLSTRRIGGVDAQPTLEEAVRAAALVTTRAGEARTR